VGLVHYDVLPLELVQVAETDPCSFKCSNADVEVVGNKLSSQNLLALLLPSNQVDHLDLRAPFLELVHPIRDGGLRHDDKVVPLNILVFPEEGQEGDSLNSFTQAHLIS